MSASFPRVSRSQLSQRLLSHEEQMNLVTSPPVPTYPDQILLLRLVQLIQELGKLGIRFHLPHYPFFFCLALRAGQQSAVQD